MESWSRGALRARVSVLVLASLVVFPTLVPPAVAEDFLVPAGTRVYVSLDNTVSGRRKNSAREGQIVHATVWRDVLVDGRVVLVAGSPATLRVEKVRHAGIAGVKGKIVLAALETRAGDGGTIQLEGGYNKTGKSRMGVSIALGAVLAWPLIFITGKPAELPKGTVIDAYTAVDFRIPEKEEAASVPTISLAEFGAGLQVEFDMTNLAASKNSKRFEFLIQNPPQGVESYVIDHINEKAVTPIPLEMVSREHVGEDETARVAIEIKKLAKLFARGINRIEVACECEGERLADEVILDIQF